MSSQKSSSGIDRLPDGSLPKNVSLSTEKPLFQYNGDSPQIFHTTLLELWESKEQVATKLGDPLKKAIPIIVIMAALMGFVLLISNLPPIIDSIAKYTKTPPVTEQIKIVYLTPEEAKARGLAVPEPAPTPKPAPEVKPTVTPTPENERLSILDVQKARPDAIGTAPETAPSGPGSSIIPNFQINPITPKTPEVKPPTPEPTPTPEPAKEEPKTDIPKDDSGYNKPKLLPE